MRLLSLEIEGFKSFGRRTVFNLDKNIIAIIGPNGSGKSNIVDAIRWLLGEQSQKQMRISEKTDILFSGSNNLNSSNEARVSLVLVNDEGKTVKISKTLERDSYNKYYVDSKQVTLKELQSVFDTGVGKNFYSIIGQGQIGEIVNASPEDIRNIVLDASNIANYLEKKENSLKLLEKANENLERINDLLFMVDKRLKSLSIRAGRAKKYLEYVEEIKRIGKVYFGVSKVKFMNQIKAYESKLTNNSEVIKELLGQLFEVERKYRSLKDEIESVDKQLSTNGDLVENYRQRLQLIEKEKLNLSEKINSLNSELLNKKWEHKSLEEKIVDLEEKLSTLNEQVNKYRIEKEEKEKLYNLKLEEKEKSLKILQEKEGRLKELEQYLLKLEPIIKELVESIEKNKIQYTNNQNKISLLQEQKKSLELTYNEINQKLQDLERELSATENFESKLEESTKKETLDLKKTEDSYNTLHSEILKMQEIEREKTFNYTNLKRQINEYEGYSEVTKEFFKKFGNDSNVVDVVANLIKTDEKYEEAVSTIAGARLQNVVIKNSSKAKEYLDYLKQTINGKITFLPLDLLRTRVSLKKSFLNEPGVIDFVLDIIVFDENYRKVMEYIFSNALLVDNLDTAIRISKMNYNGNIVTLSGELVSGYGSITGGKSKYDYSSFLLKRKREMHELEEELEKIREEINIKTNALNVLGEEVKVKKSKLENLRDELRNLYATKNIHLSEFKRMKEEEEKLEIQIKQVQDKLLKCEEENNYFNNCVQDFKTKLEEYQRQQIALKEEKNNIYKQIDSLKVELSSKDKKIVEYKIELESTIEKYEYFRKENLEISDDLIKSKKRLEELSQETNKINQEIDKINETFESLENDNKFLNEEISRLFDIMKTSRSGKHDKSKSLEKYENHRNELKESVNKIREENQKLEYEIKDVNNNIKFLVEKAKNLGIQEEDFELKDLPENDIKALENRLNDLEDSLKKIGSVDLTVLDEYEDVQKEYEESKRNKEDILNSINSLKSSIKKLDEEAESQFSGFFEDLNKEFGSFISKLFPNGYGELNLLGEGKAFEKGIQISVKKAGRNFQKLSLFSGGEKALIAIAFLFALINLNPSPFYILDEIDAPLDDINTAKVADLILENSQKSQFLIITHNKLMMEIAEIFYGITMKDGVTYVVPVDFRELER